MNLLRRLIVLCFFLTAFIAGVSAQTTPAEPKEGSVETKYDADKNETTIEISQLTISVDKANMALLTVSVVFTGKKMPATQSDVIFITSVLSNGARKFQDINNVELISDGKSIGQIIMLNLDQRKYSDTEILESVGTRMKMDVFKKLAAAERVTFKMADITFTIDAANIASLAAYEKAVNP